MDVPTQRINDAAEIEKQVSPDGAVAGPQILSEVPVKNKSSLVNLLAVLGISIVGATAVIFMLFLPFSGKKSTNNSTVTTTTMQVGSSPNVVFETEYINPFASTAQYSNPFVATKNPFTAFAQQ